MSRLSSDADLFEFESDGWLERLRRYECAESLGSLGPYELVAEAGRGGQGVVYRALQPVTRREIAVKRLLAGKLSSPESLRRFEREIATSSALSHPGIVAVYGVDFVGGAPLLAMEWVEGVPVTEWALGRPRAEVLACFLSVCDAVQHAHQHGVLHRDVKPSNVLVDAAGRPRLLDFGLARLFQTDSSITTSGVFLGTPAYAAPEQLDGAELDVRADVFSLGAILFEMLTGRRLLEGDGMEALLRAARTLVPPRPSSLEPSIPRDLDAIVLQALARERAERYQSVDAFATDLRRFVAGAPVLAQPPSGWYLLRKLVARNRLATFLVAALVVGALTAGIAYAVMSAQHAQRLTEERDKAFRASAAADKARQEADDERHLAEEARDDARTEASRARAEQQNTEAVLAFFLEDVLAAVDPVLVGHQPSLLELLQAAVPRIPDRFTEAPFVEARVRGMLGDALAALGDYTAAERELRAALAVRTQDPSSTPGKIAALECSLGEILHCLGRYEDAEAALLSAEAHALEGDPRASRVLFVVYTALTRLYGETGRYDCIDRTMARQLESASDERERLVALNSRASMLNAKGKTREALAVFDGILADTIAARGEDSMDVGILLFNRGSCRFMLGDFEGGEEDLRRSLAIRTRVFGPDHSVTASVMAKLAEILVTKRKSLPEAEDLARRALAILRASASDGLDLAWTLECLSKALTVRGECAEAAPYVLEALALIEEHLGRDENWAQCATDAVKTLGCSERLDEAEQLLDQLVAHPQGPSRGLSLRLRAAVQEKRGNLEEALELYDQALPLLVAEPRDKEEVQTAFRDFADLLRRMDDDAGAAEVLRQAAEVPK